MYRLGTIGTGTISHDLNRWWHRVRGKDDPYLKIGEANVSGDKSDSGYVWALKDINLEVMPGEVLGIIGKNGAGKSTLLKILSRVTGPTTGRISYTGRIGSLLEVGTGFHPELTGRENIFLNGAILGMTKVEISRKLDEIVDFAGVERYIDTPVKRYSSGMRVRLGFAVAAFLEPDILVVDEVLAVGDAEFQKKAIGKMQDVSHQEGRTILFVSHNMVAVQHLCSKVIILNNGVINFEGEAEKGVTEYIDNDSSKAMIKVSDRKDRLGTGNLKVLNLSFIDPNERKEIETLQSGKRFILKIDYEGKGQLKNVIFRIIFIDKNDLNLFVCNNFHTNEVFETLPAKGAVFCEIDKLTLTQGRYNIHLQVQTDREVADELEFVKDVIVERSDYFSSGKIPNIKSIFHIDQKWYL